MSDERARPPRQPASPHPSAGSVITVYEDGPYLVRGTYVVRAQDGEELEFTRRTIALCRCGKSRMRPLCDGTHRLIKFRAAGARELDLDADRGGPSPTPAAARTAARTSAGTVLATAQDAHRCLSESLLGPCLARDFAQMRVAEPLVAATCSLLRWSIARTGDVPHARRTGGETGVVEARKLVGEVLSQAMRLPRDAPSGGAEQICSLLADAALALRSDGRSTARARGPGRREP